MNSTAFRINTKNFLKLHCLYSWVSYFTIQHCILNSFASSCAVSYCFYCSIYFLKPLSDLYNGESWLFLLLYLLILCFNIDLFIQILNKNETKTLIPYKVCFIIQHNCSKLINLDWNQTEYNGEVNVPTTQPVENTQFEAKSLKTLTIKYDKNFQRIIVCRCTNLFLSIGLHICSLIVMKRLIILRNIKKPSLPVYIRKGVNTFIRNIFQICSRTQWNTSKQIIFTPHTID